MRPARALAVEAALWLLEHEPHLLVPSGAGRFPPPSVPRKDPPPPVAIVPGRRARQIGPSPAERLLARSRERARKAQKGSP